MNTHDKLKLAAELGVEMPHYTNTDNPIDFPVRGAAHDDTALLWQALEALDDAQGHIEAELNDRMDLYKGYPNLAYKYESEQRSLQQNQEAITALRERLGEKA